MPTPIQVDRPDPFAPATLGRVTLRNRIIKSATYENMARDGSGTRCMLVPEPDQPGQPPG